jgi:DHA1 family bicyclomycin/chloramphenicol resistance-like MFS transporter
MDLIRPFRTKKKPLFWIISLHTSFISCVFVTDIDTFIGLRLFKLLGCAATVASVSMVRDLFPKDIPKCFIIDAGCRAFMLAQQLEVMSLNIMVGTWSFILMCMEF